MIFSVFMKSYKKILFQIYEHAWLVILMAILILYYLGLVSMFLAGEEIIVEHYSWWFSVTITTVGYGDFYPETSVGRFIAGVVMCSGIGIAGLVIGKLSEFVMSFASKKSKGFGYMRQEKHTLIMGYRKGSTEKIISELLINDPHEKIVLCSYEQEVNPLIGDEVRFIKGELASEDVLQRSNAAFADNIIVHGSDDNQTFFTAYALRSINKAAHMVCYLNNEDHVSKIKMLPSDSDSLNQVILPVNVYLMAQELQDKESSNIIQQLISNFSGGNLYRLDIPHDSGFQESFNDIFFSLKTKYQATAIAVKDSEVVLNPSLDLSVSSGMAIFYTASERINNIDLRLLGREL